MNTDTPGKQHCTAKDSAGVGGRAYAPEYTDTEYIGEESMTQLDLGSRTGTPVKGVRVARARASDLSGGHTAGASGTARRMIRRARERAVSIYLAAGAYTAATATSLTSSGATAASASDSVSSLASGPEGANAARARMLVVAAFFCAVSVLALVLPQSVAHAQGGGFEPEQGADEIWEVIGIVGMLVGAIVGIGAIFTRKVLAGLGFLLAGGIVWVVSQDPEGTMGAAAEWIMDAF